MFFRQYFFFWFFLHKITYTQNENISHYAQNGKMSVFGQKARKPRKAENIWKFITPLFFVQFNSTKAQIGCHDKSNRLGQVAVQYLESFFLHSSFNLSWVHKADFLKGLLHLAQKPFHQDFFQNIKLSTTRTLAIAGLEN